MEKRRNITDEQFEEAVKDVLGHKPAESAIPDDYEPTEEELQQRYRLDSPPSSDEDETER